MLAARDDEVITTGEAAARLGVSRQHVVDLCKAGTLPYFLVGQHRRLRRADVDQVRDGSQRLRRDQLGSLLLAHAVAGRLVMDPGPTRDLARQRLAHMQAASPRGSARVWLDEWVKLLDAPLPDLLSALTSRAQRSRELREHSPFTGVLTDAERTRVLAATDNPGAAPTDTTPPNVDARPLTGRAPRLPRTTPRHVAASSDEGQQSLGADPAPPTPGG